LAKWPVEIPSEWWKAPDYTITDGCFAPAPGAKSHSYDPMEIYWQSAQERSRGSRRVEAPYAELIRLMYECRWEPSREGQVLTRDSQELLLGWVRSHGLLGVLPHITLRVLGRYGREGEAEESCTGPVVILWAGDVYTRDRASADLNIIPWGRIRSVTAQVQELRAEEITARPWSDVARPFFAQPRKRGVDYPLPEKDEFWRVYREPIDRFWEAANTLRSVFEDLSRWGE